MGEVLIGLQVRHGEGEIRKIAEPILLTQDRFAIRPYHMYFASRASTLSRERDIR